tara:strand:+ start:504 stop:797 length:294 start_codon:yes stop_codon:yes gene_type:complete
MRGPFFVHFDGKTVVSFEVTGSRDLALSSGEFIPDDGRHDYRMFSVHPEENKYLSRDGEGYWRFAAPAQKPISYKPKSERKDDQERDKRSSSTREVP